MIDFLKFEVLLNYKIKIEVCRILDFNYKKFLDDKDKMGEKVKIFVEV